MAQIKLDDLLVKKKEAPQVLDLSKCVVRTKEEFQKLLDKVPEYKIRPEKVHPEDCKIKDKNCSFKPRRKEIRRQSEYSYANPVPPDMRSVALEDLSPVPIDWKMLTSVRPRLKLEEEMFSRLVTMGKLHLSTAAKDKKATGTNSIRKTKNRAGIIETRAEICAECSEEFCSGLSCGEFLYENFLRTDEFCEQSTENTGNGSSPERKKFTKKKKKRTKSSKERKTSKKKGKKKSEKKQVTQPEVS